MSAGATAWRCQTDMSDARRYTGQGAKDMPSARHARSVRARTWRRRDQHGVWCPPYAPDSGAEALGAGHFSAWESHIITKRKSWGVLSAPTLCR